MSSSSCDHHFLLGHLPKSGGGDLNVHDVDDDSLHFLSQPFYPSPEPSLDFLQPLTSTSSSSPPSQQMDSLSIVTNRSNSGVMNCKARLMHRSFSSQCLSNQKKKKPPPQPCLSSFSDNHHDDLQEPVGCFSHMMRRACITGDLKRMVGMVAATTATTKGGSHGNGSPLSGHDGSLDTSNLSSPLCGEETMVLGAFTVGRYSSEERKQRIDRYRIKRNHRNFNKTIKYACRKTLADSRPRVRGRFAKNDGMGDVPIPQGSGGLSS